MTLTTKIIIGVVVTFVVLILIIAVAASKHKSNHSIK